MSSAYIDVRVFVQTECLKSKSIDITRLALKAQEVVSKYQLEDVREHIAVEVARIQGRAIKSAVKH